MKCNLEWLSAYLDGALAEDKRALLEEHLKTCEACTAKLEEFARVEQVAKRIPAPQLSEAYWENFAGRVQNKLTIREKQKTSPGWLETLKSLFQPTTGKLAIAGSVAVLILLTFISLDQWKKQTFRPPVFKDEKPKTEEKLDSAQVPAKYESAFRTAEKDNKAGLVEDKLRDQPVRERGTATLSQKPAENVPAASVPLGRALAAPEEQKLKEEPSLVAFAERDDAIEGDTVLVTAGKKAEIRKEVATSQVKVSAEEVEKLPVRSAKNLSKTQLGVKTRDGRITISDTQQNLNQSAAESHKQSASPKPNISWADTLKVRKLTEQELLEIQKGVSFDTCTIHIRQADSTKKRASSAPGIPAIDTVQVLADIRQAIDEKEKELSGSVSKSKAESLYSPLGYYYMTVYRLSQKPEDWRRANRRINEFLKKELSDFTRQRLLEIQADLKKMKR